MGLPPVGPECLPGSVCPGGVPPSMPTCPSGGLSRSALCGCWGRRWAVLPREGGCHLWPPHAPPSGCTRRALGLARPPGSLPGGQALPDGCLVPDGRLVPRRRSERRAAARRRRTRAARRAWRTRTRTPRRRVRASGRAAGPLGLRRLGTPLLAGRPWATCPCGGSGPALFSETVDTQGPELQGMKTITTSMLVWHQTLTSWALTVCQALC